MSLRRLALVVVFLALPGLAAAQVLSEQQLQYLRQLFIESTAEAVDGTAIAVGTLPVDRIQGKVPAAKLTEGDPVALPVATSAAATASAAATDAAAALAAAAGASGGVSGLGTRVAALETSAAVWNQAAVDASAATNVLAAGVPASLEFGMVGYTVRLYFASSGVLTNFVQEGP